MTELICDICGTMYPDNASRCPTCGYARAVEAPVRDEDDTSAERKKIPGGRYSKKNVQRRLHERNETGEQPQPEELTQEAPEPVPAREADPPQPQPDEAQRRAFRRDVALNLLLSAAVVAFLAAGGYLLVYYGIPWMKAMIG